MGSSKLKFCKKIRGAAKRRRNHKSASDEEKLALLHEDIMIMPYHIFGDHKKCAEIGGWPCEDEKIEGEENNVPLLSETDTLPELSDEPRNLAVEIESLLLDATTDLAEGFNSILCETNTGKRRVTVFGDKGTSCN